MHQSARFDFKLHVRWFSSAGSRVLYLHRASNFNPANFRISSRDWCGSEKPPVNRKERGRNDGRSRPDQLSENVINRPAYHLDFNFSVPADPRSSSSPSIPVFIIVTVIRRYARSYSFLYTVPPPPPLLDSTRRIETGGITGLNDIGFRRRIICLSQTIGLIFLLLIYD